MIDEIVQKLQETAKKSENNQFSKDSAELSEYYINLKKQIEELREKKRNLIENEQKLKEGDFEISSELTLSDLEAKELELYRKKEEKQEMLNQIRAKAQENMNKKKRYSQKVENMKQEQEKLHNKIVGLCDKRTKLEQRLDGINKELDQKTQHFQHQTEEYQKLQMTVSDLKKRVQQSLDYINEVEGNLGMLPMIHLYHNCKAHSGAIYAIDFCSDYQTFMTIGDDKQLIFWSLPSVTVKNSITVPSIPLSLRQSPNNKLVSVSCKNGGIYVYDMETCRHSKELKSHVGECLDHLWISQNEIISASADRSVKIYDYNRGSVTRTIPTFNGAFSLCPTSQPKVFAVGLFNGTIGLIDTRQMKIIKKIEKVHSDIITSLIFVQSSNSIFSLGKDSLVCQTNLSTEKRVSYMRHDSLVVDSQYSKISIDPASNYITAGSNNGSVFLFDFETGNKYENKFHTNPVLCSAYASNLLITADTSNTLAFWTSS